MSRSRHPAGTRDRYLLWPILGGLLAPIAWRMVFVVSVPIGLFGPLATPGARGGRPR